MAKLSNIPMLVLLAVLKKLATITSFLPAHLLIPKSPLLADTFLAQFVEFMMMVQSKSLRTIVPSVWELASKISFLITAQFRLLAVQTSPEQPPFVTRCINQFVESSRTPPMPPTLMDVWPALTPMSSLIHKEPVRMNLLKQDFFGRKSNIHRH